MGIESGFENASLKSSEIPELLAKVLFHIWNRYYFK